MKAKAHPIDHNRRMNKEEEAYAEILEADRLAGRIQLWLYESIKLRLADRTWYTPDFMVVDDKGYVWFIEYKGWFRDDARVKIKVAAEEYPMFKFVCVMKQAKKNGGGYKQEEFNG